MSFQIGNFWCPIMFWSVCLCIVTSSSYSLMKDAQSLSLPSLRDNLCVSEALSNNKRRKTCNNLCGSEALTNNKNSTSLSKIGFAYFFIGTTKNLTSI